MDMRHIAARLIMGLALSVGVAADAAADFDAGWQAYQSGDHETAARAWAEAGEEGDSRAQFNVGVLYDRGLGVARDPLRAKDWWRRAAGQGHEAARHNLALLLIEEGGDAGLQEAVGWLEQAAQQGFVRSLYTLGKLYESGLGVEPDAGRAFELIRGAAEAGFVKAQYSLGKLYRDGSGTAVDLTAAAAWFRRAAEQGYGKAQSRLATRYRRGEGVERDLVEALKWAILALGQGYEPALELQVALSAALSEAEIDEARRRAEAFRSGAETSSP